jgi:predicted ATPase
MLTRLQIKGYKCLDQCELPLAPLTLLSGPNASGKSTVLQAMLLTFSGFEQKNVSYLKEVAKPFSQFEDIYCRYSNADEIRIDLAAKNGGYTSVMDRSGLKAVLCPDTAPLGYEQNLFYLSAGRSGPEELSEINRDLRIGQHGQFALGLLEQRKDKPIHPSLIHPQAHANTLKGQLAWWLSFIAGVETEARTEKVTAATVKTTFQTGGLENISPFNTGAGNSFLLKLLVMCLTASPGDLLLIENPEIHLHPGAQSRLGTLLAFLAAREVQAIVETHCEHLIHRVRYEIYTGQLATANALIHYKPGVRDPFETLYVNERGHFCDSAGREIRFPEGFFDSTLAELLEMG